MPLHEYLATLEALYALEAARGMDFKLERVARALERRGNPQRRYPSIHVAGTNGKGSVAAMLHAVYLAAGYRVGLYTSPHLVDFRERIRVGHELVSEADVVAHAATIQRNLCELGIELTFFELVTVMAFEHFAREGVDLAVIEVGLGGRLDATNVIDSEIAVITSISRDHEDYLGSDLASIAREKGGIIKNGRPLIIGDLPDEAAQVIEAIAAVQHSSLRRYGRDFVVSNEGNLMYSSASLHLNEIRISLRGRHQRQNAAIALATIETMLSRLPVSESAIRRGLATVQWPGRIEIREGAPRIILDGAHNEAGVAALVDELDDLGISRPLILLFGVMRDKRWHPMSATLGRVVDGVVVTCPHPTRAVDGDLLAAAFRSHSVTRVEPLPLRALQQAVQMAGAGGTVLVAGSLFLVGAVSPHLDAIRQQGLGVGDDCLSGLV